MMRELDLDSLLREPIVRMVMERDGLSSGDIRQTFQRVQSARTLRTRAAEGLLAPHLCPEAGEAMIAG